MNDLGLEVERRVGLMQEIKRSNDIGASNQRYLLALVKEKKVEMEKKELWFREKLL